MNTSRWPDVLRRQLAALVADDFEAYAELEDDAARAMAAAMAGSLDHETLVLCAGLSGEICRRLREARDRLHAELAGLDTVRTRPAPYAGTAAAPSFDLRF